MLKGDKNRLQQVVINLIKNSIKAAKQSGFIRIFIAYHEEEQELRVKVQDNGVGLNRATLMRLNTMLSKQQNRMEDDNELDSNFNGLNICKQILHHYGGKIKYASMGTNKGVSVMISMNFVKVSEFE